MSVQLSSARSQTNESAKPFLRWAGSKRKLVKKLNAFWNDSFDRYVEPFAGSACLFLEIDPKRALLADKNQFLIETYETVGRRAASVYDSVTEIGRDAETYYRIRAQDPAGLSKFDRVVRFIYLNRNCFNGIYRTNQSGQFNVPYASFKVGAFVTKQEFVRTAKRFRNAELRAWDFGVTLRYVRSGDFVYLDPPYVVESRRVFREYGQRPFTHGDLVRLQRHLERIDKRGATFVVSYADCKESRLLGARWNMRRIKVRRHIAGFGGARKAAYELLISNT